MVDAIVETFKQKVSMLPVVSYRMSGYRCDRVIPGLKTQGLEA